MKKHVLALIGLLFVGQIVLAQDEGKEEKKGFRKENFYVGGSISLQISSGTFGIGATPEFGYSLARWVDLGIVANYNYTSYKNYYISNQVGTLKQTIYGGGVYTRLYPVRFLYAQAQLEHNWIALKFKSNSGGDAKNNVSSNSLLVGAGYTTGRDPLNKSVYGYFSVMVDVLNDKNSPYVNYNYDINGNPTGTYKIPVVRAGLIVPIFQGKNR